MRRCEWEFLDRFWEAASAPGGDVALRVSRGRQTGDEFVGWIAERNWVLSETRCKLRGSRTKSIRVLQRAAE